MKISKHYLRQIIKEEHADYGSDIGSQEMADAKRYATDKTPEGMADYLGIGVEDWHKIRAELDDHYEDRFLEDQEQFVVAVPDEMFTRISHIKRGDHQDHLYDIVDAIESGAADYTLDMLLKNIEDAEFEQRFNEGRSLIKEGNHAVDYAHGYEDARDGLPQNSDDPWYAAGFADFFEGIHDQYEALHQDGITSPPAKAGPMTAARMSESHLRKLVRTILLEEPADYYKDYKSGSITYAEYKQLVDEYESQGQSWASAVADTRRHTPAAPRKNKQASSKNVDFMGRENKWEGTPKELQMRVHKYLIDIGFYKESHNGYVDPLSKPTGPGAHPDGGYTSNIPSVMKKAIEDGEIDWANWHEIEPTYRKIDRSID